MAICVDKSHRQELRDVIGRDNLQSVLELSAALVDIQDVTALFELVAERICTRLGFSHCVVLERDSDEAFRVRANFARTDEMSVHLPPNYSIPGATYDLIAAKGESIGNFFWVGSRSEIISDPRVTPCLIPPRTTLGGPISRSDASLVLVPLLGRNGEVVGLLFPAGPPDDKVPSPEVALVLETFGHMTSVALELIKTRISEVHMQETFETRLVKVLRLFEASTTIKHEFQLEELLGRVVRKMAEAGGFSRVVVSLVDRGSTSLRMRASCGLADDEAKLLASLRLDLHDYESMLQPDAMISHSFLYDHSKFKVPVALVASGNVGQPASASSSGAWHPLNSLNIALRDSEDKTFGIISLGEPIDGKFPELSHIQALEYFADRCALAIIQVIVHRHLETAAETDALTRLPNHNTFVHQMHQALRDCVATGGTASLLFMDLDRFKLVNDTYGHQVGDLVLQRVAECLRSSVRKVDVLARFGGEEFVLFLPGSDLPSALALAEKLRLLIEMTEIPIDGDKKVKTTISIGVANTDTITRFEGDSLELFAAQLVNRADSALYHAKRAGRNRTSTTADSDFDQDEDRRALPHGDHSSRRDHVHPTPDHQSSSTP